MTPRGMLTWKGESFKSLNFRQRPVCNCGMLSVRNGRLQEESPQIPSGHTYTGNIAWTQQSVLMYLRKYVCL